MTDKEEILAEFAMEPSMTRAILKSYIDRHPKLVRDILALFNELVLSDLEAQEISDGLEIKAGNFEPAQVKKVSGALYGNNLRDLSMRLELPRLFLSGLRPDLVRISTIPTAFFKALAKTMGVGTHDVIVGMLRGGGRTYAFKSDGKPGNVVAPVDFWTCVEQASFSDEQKFALKRLTDHGPD